MTARRRVQAAATDTPMSARRAKELRERRHIILDAAEGIFAKKGYHDASMAEIARVAEFGVGYLYRHFKDKGDLYLAVVERKVDALLGATSAALSSSGSARDRLSTMARVYFTFFETNRTFFKLVIEQTPHCPYELRASHRARVMPKIQAVRAEVERVLAEGIAAREIKKADPSHLTTAFFGILQGFLGHWVFFNPEESLSAISDVAIRTFFEGWSLLRV